MSPHWAYKMSTTLINLSKVLMLINELPNEFSLDEIVENLIFLEKIEIGLQQVKQGKVVSHSTAKQKLKKWLK